MLAAVLERTVLLTRPVDVHMEHDDTTPARFECSATADDSTPARLRWYRVRGEREAGGAGDELVYNTSSKLVLGLLHLNNNFNKCCDETRTRAYDVYQSIVELPQRTSAGAMGHHPSCFARNISSPKGAIKKKNWAPVALTISL